ncbi:hypothetical protein RB595_002259 [Gaeumannomyces hyphopodioides]
MEGSARQTPLSPAEQQQLNPMAFAEGAASSQPLGSPSDVLASMPPPPSMTGSAMAWQTQPPSTGAQPPVMATSSSKGGDEGLSAAEIMRRALSASFQAVAMAGTMTETMTESLVNNPPATIAPSDLMVPTTAEIPILDAASALPIVSSSLEESPAPEERPGTARTTEHVVTLPLAANMRQRYRKVVVASKPAVVEFNNVFRSCSAIADDTLVAKIDQVLSQLLDICDLPAFDDNPAGVTREVMMKHAIDSCTKMVFVYELLHALRDEELQALILVRRGRAYEFLEAILDAKNFRYHRLEDAPKPENAVSDSLRVILAATDQDPALYPVGVNVVVNYDESARSLSIARGAVPTDTRPTVLTLAASYTVEHLNMIIPTTLEPQERKNALLIAVSKAWELVQSPPHLGDRGRPDLIANEFATLIKNPNYEWEWEPCTLPETVLEVYSSSQNTGDLEPPRVASRSASKKRQLDDAEDERDDNKRVKAYPPSSLEASRTQPQLSSAAESLLAQLPKSGAPKFAVPIDHLDAMATRISDLEKQLAEKDELAKALKAQLTSAGEQRDSVNRSLRGMYNRFNAALQDRATFEKERDSAVAKEGKLKDEISAAKAAQALLKKENAALQQRLADWAAAAAASEAGPESRVGKMAQQQLESEARQAELEKRLKVQGTDLDYAHEAYQTASSRALELDKENKRLSAQAAELERKASDNAVEIHRIQAAAAHAEQDRRRRELAALLADRDRELDRAKDELRSLRAGRRETRAQSTAPHSPRLGVMSPRGNGVAVRSAAAAVSTPLASSSRGTSPATGAGGPVGGYEASGLGPGVRTVLSRNGRLPHLMD